MKIHKNDNVTVIAGNSRGKTGKVLKVYRDDRRVIVEGVNIIRRHSRPSQRNPQGGIVQKEAPISAANIMVICPKCSEPSRFGHKQVSDSTTGRKHMMRVCRKCEEMF
ncbi:MAG: 50S ribosomal protein L24 [Ignavibacteriae bacterium]|nr:50S ribosomal protein L24 [Ignavibacteria bacterium]MBI3364475.1 50S ribosomal protein L24 [Ignavibacteriota bacterium]